MGTRIEIGTGRGIRGGTRWNGMVFAGNGLHSCWTGGQGEGTKQPVHSIRFGVLFFFFHYSFSFPSFFFGGLFQPIV